MRDATTCSQTSISRVTTTTTTPFYFPFTSTTVPGGTIAVDPGSVETLYEIGLMVPGPGLEFVSLEATITNYGRVPISPYGLRLDVDLLGYALSYVNYGIAGSCNMSITILPGGSYTCTAMFEIPEGSTTGRLVLSTYYGGSELSVPASADLDFASVARPHASVEVIAVGSVAAYGCTPRPGFQLFELLFDLSSRQGASEMTLGDQAFSVVAGGARYRPSYCGRSASYCSYLIGVPVNGSATCSLVFEMPADVGAGTLEFNDARYQAAGDFTTD